MTAPRIRILIGDAVAIGPGKALLLEKIENTGSISAAAREMGMSYRKAWGLIDSLNNDFNAEIVSKSSGGKGGGGTFLSPLGKEMLRRYSLIEKVAAESIKDDLIWFEQHLGVLKN
jgi:molybdate transport system regulatory protein